MHRPLLELDFISYLSALADLVMPRVCIVCGRRLSLKEDCICLACNAGLPLTGFELQPHNPMADTYNEILKVDRYEQYQWASALFFYGKYSAITVGIKYKRNFQAARHFGRLLGRHMAAARHLSDADLLVPVPLHGARRRRRGYNQAELIAKAALRELDGAQLRTDLLKRRRATRSQAHLASSAREGNVAGAFSVNGRVAARLSGVRHIVVIDDVFTSGYTLAECHRALRAAFPPEVRISAVTLGYAGKRV